MKRIKILILDDEQGIRQEISEFLKSTGFTVFEASDPPEAFGLLTSNYIDIAIVDIRLPVMSGLEVLQRFKKLHPGIEVIMISGHGDMDTVIQALREGAVDYLKKPFHLHEVLKSIEKTKRYITFRELLREKQEHESLLSPALWERIGSPFIFNSPVMDKLYSQMVRVSVADSTTVLIIGESGTGKELVAHGIHLLSNRREKAFISVNCSSVPEDLFESEFFGYKKGAFTGAIQDKPGWFEAADEGTLFLDEVGDLKPSLQAKLLRIMDNQTVSRLGTTKTFKVNVRVIAATNHNLQHMVDDGRFRQDLFHRLNAFTITIPPLRERKEDISLLLEYYMNSYATLTGKEVRSVSPSLLAMLEEYDFPGNVRELKHMIERAVILCDGDELMEEHFDYLMDKMHAGRQSAAGSQQSAVGGRRSAVGSQQSAVGSRRSAVGGQEPGTRNPEPGTVRNFDFRQYEKETIEKALKESNHNKSKAARMLGISRQSLDRRMKKFGID